MRRAFSRFFVAERDATIREVAIRPLLNAESADNSDRLDIYSKVPSMVVICVTEISSCSFLFFLFRGPAFSDHGRRRSRRGRSAFEKGMVINSPFASAAN